MYTAGNDMPPDGYGFTFQFLNRVIIPPHQYTDDERAALADEFRPSYERFEAEWKDRRARARKRRSFSRALKYLKSTMLRLFKPTEIYIYGPPVSSQTAHLARDIGVIVLFQGREDDDLERYTAKALNRLKPMLPPGGRLELFFVERDSFFDRIKDNEKESLVYRYGHRYYHRFRHGSPEETL